MIHAISSTLVALLFSGSAPIQAAQPPTVESLRAEHAAHALAIRSLVTVEVVQTHNPRSPTWEAQTRGYLERRVASERERIVSTAAALDVPESERGLLSQQRMRAQGSADLPAEYMPVWWANEHEYTRQRLVCDFAGQRLRLEQRDLRDLAQLRTQFGIVPEQDQNLDSTRTLIVTAGYTLLVNRDDTFATVLRGGSRGLADRLLLLGVVPAAMLDGRYPLDVAVNPDGTIGVRGAHPDSGLAAFELTLRAEQGHHMTHMIRYGRDGEPIEELTLSDYRRVTPGTSAPFHTEMTRGLGGALGERSETREVASIELNAPVENATFEPPSGARVGALDPEAWEAYKNRPGRPAARE